MTRVIYVSGEPQESTYTIEDGVYTINLNPTAYAIVQGKIFWMFLSRDDVTDTSKAAEIMYCGSDISEEDRDIITAVVGFDGVWVGGNSGDICDEITVMSIISTQ